MPTLSYSVSIDSRKVLDTQLDLLFQEIEDYVNVTLIDTALVESATIDYRTLSQPPMIELGAKASQHDAGSFATIDAVAYGGFYYITNTVLKHDSTHVNAPNRNTVNQNVIHVTGYIYHSDLGNTTNATNACIGYSSDGGATWTPITPSTIRPFHRADAYTIYRPYNSVYQQSYYDNSNNYVPFNIPRDRPVVVEASFGGDVANSSVGSKNAFAIMVDTTALADEHLLDVEIWLNAREQGF